MAGVKATGTVQPLQADAGGSACMELWLWPGEQRSFSVTPSAHLLNVHRCPALVRSWLESPDSARVTYFPQFLCTLAWTWSRVRTWPSQFQGQRWLPHQAPGWRDHFHAVLQWVVWIRFLDSEKENVLSRMHLQYLVSPSVSKCAKLWESLRSCSAGPCHLSPADLTELLIHPEFSSYIQEVSYSLSRSVAQTLTGWSPSLQLTILFWNGVFSIQRDISINHPTFKPFYTQNDKKKKFKTYVCTS